MAANRAITVRVSEARLRKLMRARRVATQSELINTLVAEEEERLRSYAVLRETARTVRARDVDDRFSPPSSSIISGRGSRRRRVVKAVAVRELKNRLSAYLREVGTGEVVLVTDRGRVVAELRRPRAEALPSPAEHALERLVAAGVLTI